MIKDKGFIELIGRAVGGDERAFAAICEQKSRDIIYMATRVSGNLHDGEDLAQEVLIKMHRGIGRLRQPEYFDVWLYRMVLNEYKMMKRKTAVKPNIPVDLVSGDIREERLEFLPQEYVENEEKKQALLGVIDALSPRHQQVILLYYFEDMSYRDIAEVMNLSPSAVDGCMRRARKLIRRNLEKQMKTPLERIYAMSPLPVVTQVLGDHAKEIVSNDSVRAVLVGYREMIAAGASLGYLASRTVPLATPALAKLVVGVAATVTVAVAAWAVTTNVTGPLSSSIPGGGEFPQHFQASGMEGELEIDGAVVPADGGGALTPGARGEQGEEALPGAGTTQGAELQGLVGGQVYLSPDGEVGEGVDGVSVALYAADDTKTSLMTTKTKTINGISGKYFFTNLPEGTYMVKATLPEGANFVNGGRSAWLKDANAAQVTLDSERRENKGVSGAATGSTPIAGSVKLLGGEEEVIGGQPYVEGLTVDLLDEEGAVLQTARISGGTFRFAPVAIGATQTYTLQLSSSQLVFAKANPGGAVRRTVKPLAGAENITIYVADYDAPVGNISFVGGQCACGHLNPETAQIGYTDAIAVTVEWRVLDSAGAVVKSGTGESAPLSGAGPAGWYLLEATLRDAAGNASIGNAEFEIK